MHLSMQHFTASATESSLGLRSFRPHTHPELQRHDLTRSLENISCVQGNVPEREFERRNHSGHGQSTSGIERVI